ncbi:MAG: type 2 isopentenyl-diphosphate Delta-isomerase [Candidatus Aenigmarchaeota archaeon]|nr:type 2 isopentenyl-diphosphate Delta-isomerase [Candidatus Aenigmarchaeota archaeon]
MSSLTKSRKGEHIRICLTKDVQFSKSNGFECIEFEHIALPEIDRDEIDLSTKFLGKKFDYPLFIEAMTGGTKLGERINKNLAKAAELLGIGMGVGSQRAMLENHALKKTYYVRDVAPNIFLLGNIGAVQLPQYKIDDIKNLVYEIDADGLAIHLNPAQELAQPEGDANWKNVLKHIKILTKSAKFPVVAKEVGHGISGYVAYKLVKAGVKAIDIAGAGGTSWVKVEKYRGKKDVSHIEEWGIPTAEALLDVLETVNIPVIASGGMRTAEDIVKALSLGADLVGMAYPLLKPATQSWKKVKEYLEKIIEQMKDIMVLLGCKDLKELRRIRIEYNNQL